jgi:CDP-diglyceride synthetase
LLVPVKVYVFALLFSHPLGWFLMNLLAPIKALTEYAQVHEQILRYVLTHESSNAAQTKQFESLLRSLNNIWLTIPMMVSFHLAILCFSTKKVGFYLVALYVVTFIIKLTRFHFYMLKKGDKVDAEFHRDALVLSCLSLFLEVFGHIFISLITGLGYAIYIMNKQYMLLIIVTTVVADSACKLTSPYIGNRPFAKYIAPKMYVESVVVYILTSTVLNYLFYVASQHAATSSYFLQISKDEYLMFGQVIGSLSIIGNLLVCFLKRCANMDESDSIKTKSEHPSSVV